MLYFQGRGHAYLASFGVFRAAITSAVTRGVQPQMLSLLLLCIFLHILRSFKRAWEKYVWLIPPLMMLRANLFSICNYANPETTGSDFGGISLELDASCKVDWLE